MSESPSDPRVINESESAPDWSRWDPRHHPDAGKKVLKIVLGPSPGRDQDKGIEAKLPKELATWFPNLTHLHLWAVTDLIDLPSLPSNLRWLDVRACAGVVTIGNMPATLETLVLEGSPQLNWSDRNQRTSFPALDDLSIQGCVQISEAWLHDVLRQGGKLKKLNASDCPQLTRIPAWATHLVDVRLNQCVSLTSLPKWPDSLRRIGLRGARSLRRLPDFHPGLDFIDLAGTESLHALPEKRGKPRTLFLHGSGVRVPPASQHGKSADENVAKTTSAFFEDVELTGPGDVKRCKLLLLGNGDAGKTSLALALIPGGDPAEAKRMGSTQGVQFLGDTLQSWGWEFSADVNGLIEAVQLHLWDFGGQEIYHNTHRLFMSKGSVFILVWDPAQDGKQPPRSECGYQDEWRPIQYWLDFIHMACPHQPRIALVCSKTSALTDDLERRWRGQINPEFEKNLKCFYIDSLGRQGQLDDLHNWLSTEVGSVVHEQGVVVPTYWEIAQDLVQSWVERMHTDSEFASRYNQIPTGQFRDELGSAIYNAIATDREGRFAKLAEAIRSRKFELNDDRAQRTLSFLTHSGWLYWDPSLFEGRVIIGQKWALDGIYTVLDRRRNSRVYRELNNEFGRFTVSQLGEWVWNEKRYAPAEQELLRSFMETCGLCFRLRRAEDAWREQDLYLSFEHLPKAREIRLQREFEETIGSTVVERSTLDIPRLHKYDWQRFLTDAGSKYGKNAQYALDGFYLQNEEGDHVLILCHLRPGGLGGEIEFRVSGPKAKDRLMAVEEHVRYFVEPNLDRPPSDTRQALGQSADIRVVFISYACEPPQQQGNPWTIPPGYEVPVDAIERHLKGKPVRLIRDKTDLRFGHNLRRFLIEGPRSPHVIVVYSDKYWRSPYAIFELWNAMDEIHTNPGKRVTDVIIPVEHINGSLKEVEKMAPFIPYWDTFTGTPGVIRWTPDELRDQAKALIRNFATHLQDLLDFNLPWADGKERVLAEIDRRLGVIEPRSRHVR